MYIRLDELMQYIDSYEKAYFNTHTFEMKYAHELAKNLDIEHWHNYRLWIEINIIMSSPLILKWMSGLYCQK